MIDSTFDYGWPAPTAMRDLVRSLFDPDNPAAPELRALIHKSAFEGRVALDELRWKIRYRLLFELELSEEDLVGSRTQLSIEARTALAVILDSVFKDDAEAIGESVDRSRWQVARMLEQGKQLVTDEPGFRFFLELVIHTGLTRPLPEPDSALIPG